MTNQERERIWVERYASYRSSGQTKIAWCKSKNIDVKSFYRWGRRLNDRIEKNPQNQNRFILAKEISENDNQGFISITIGKATISVTKYFDPTTLETVLQLVGSIC